MSIKIVQLRKKDVDGFSIWIDEDEGFDYSSFLKLIEPLNIKAKETVYSCVGPAQFIDEINTEAGIFNLSQEFDEFAGITIYSENINLMEKILDIMLESAIYHIRG